VAGYKPVSIIQANIPHMQFPDGSNDSTEALTRAFVLCPLATAITFVAFVTAALSEKIGTLVASMATLLALLLTLVALVCQYMVFGVVGDAVEDSRVANVFSYRGGAACTTLLALIFLFSSGVILFATSCTASRQSRNT
jgi:hypothetical protein